MKKLAVIGGTGLTALEGLEIIEEIEVDTPYGKPSAPLLAGKYKDREIIFLARHGNPHTIQPHMVNYRANIRSLSENGVEEVIAVNAVGGITREMHPERIVVPDQIVDYTWGRKHTFFEEDLDHAVHIDFTHPYSEPLRRRIITAAAEKNMDIIDSGTYGATQGPRLESAGEIKRMQVDGCNIVGMTGMPETALAKELSLDYACIALVVNWAAGKDEDVITMDVIEQHLKHGMEQVMALLGHVLDNA